jgi:serine protease Do
MVARVSPAVVRVITVRPPTHEEDKPGAKVVNHSPAGRTSTATGSGYIIDPAGYIGTNKHVIDGAISVFVVTADGIHYPATIVGMPVNADMALLRIDAGYKPLPFVRFGDSDEVRVGNRVFAIGSPFGFDNTVTSGIVSALNRDIMESPFDDYLQTDAAINHGNSGGPLFNMAGEVVGMTSVIFSPDPGSSGVGFALPSNSLRFVFDRLMKTGKIDAGSPGGAGHFGARRQRRDVTGQDPGRRRDPELQRENGVGSPRPGEDGRGEAGWQRCRAGNIPGWRERNGTRHDAGMA